MEDKNYLEISVQIKEWIINSDKKIPPSKKSKDETEKQLAKELKFIQKKIIKPYKKLKKEEQIKAFSEKYPDIEKIINIMQEIENIDLLERLNEESVHEHKEIDVEIENEFEKEQTPEFEYDKENIKQTSLVDSILKDIKIRKQIEGATKLKQKYEEE